MGSIINENRDQWFSYFFVEREEYYSKNALQRMNKKVDNGIKVKE